MPKLQKKIEQAKKAKENPKHKTFSDVIREALEDQKQFDVKFGQRTFLDQVKDTVEARQSVRGSRPAHFHTSAALWSAYLGKKITPHDVAMLQTLEKVSRQRNGYKHDDAIDIAGYADCAFDLNEDAKFQEQMTAALKGTTYICHPQPLMAEVNGKLVPVPNA